jgi:hypothetical protein
MNALLRVFFLFPRRIHHSVFVDRHLGFGGFLFGFMPECLLTVLGKKFSEERLMERFVLIDGLCALN